MILSLLKVIAVQIRPCSSHDQAGSNGICANSSNPATDFQHKHPESHASAERKGEKIGPVNLPWSNHLCELADALYLLAWLNSFSQAATYMSPEEPPLRPADVPTLVNLYSCFTELQQVLM